MQFVALFSLVLASVSASAVLRRDGETKTCQLFDSVRPDKATCNYPADTFCPGGCKSTVVSENCKELGTYKLIPGKVICDGAFTKADADGYSCEGGQVGSVLCLGPWTGNAVCSGCTAMTDEIKKHLQDVPSSTDPPAGNSSPSQPGDMPAPKTDEKPAPNTNGKPEDKPDDKTDGKPDDKTGGKPDDKTGGKPDDKTGDKPDDKTGDKPDDKTGDKPDDKIPGMPSDGAAGQKATSTSCYGPECANQTATPTGAVATGSANPSPAPDSPSGAEALLSSGPVGSAIVALLTAGFSALL